ncbi:MAG: DUF1648 domain-containing protein [Anaerolineales bacterium]
MNNKTTIILSFGLLLIALLAGAVLYNQLPDPMPSHWNAAGEVDGYTPRFWGVFLLPLMTAGILLLFLVIPSIDPLRANIAQFRETYNLLIVGFTFYMLYIHGLTLAAALGVQFNMTVMLLPAVGLLFIGIGLILPRAKRNFFIGIRTPWTLSSDTVWEETHRVGAWAFGLAGGVTILSAFLGESGIWLLLGALMLAAFVPVVYSYILWRRENP